MVRKKLLLLVGFVVAAVVVLRRRGRDDPVQVEIADVGSQEPPTADEEVDEGATADVEGDEEEEDRAGDEEGSAAGLESIEGIGPAYADRLRSVNVDDVADLAAADAGDLAGETDIAEARIRDWIEQAGERVDG